jgi:hypothetical protein
MNMSPIYTKTLVSGLHSRSFQIEPVPAAAGWIVCEEADQHIVQRRRYTDWHRVERAVTRFVGQVAELRRQGWIDIRAR